MLEKPCQTSEGEQSLSPSSRGFYKTNRCYLIRFIFISGAVFGTLTLICYDALKDSYSRDIVTLASQNLFFLRMALICSLLFVILLSSIVYWIFLKNKYVREERKALLLRSEKIIELNSKMAELGQLSATLIHELGNPLNVLDLAVNQLKKNPELKNNLLLESSCLALNKMKSLVRSVKSYTHKPHCLDAPPHFKDCLQETLILLEQTLRIHKIKCLGHVDSDITFIGDASKMGQVLINLIINAKDALTSIDANERWIKVESQSLWSGTTQIRISNSGPAISEEVEKNMFTPYFTTKERGLGTGLGLPTCVKILESMNLTLRYEKFEGRTSFIISGFTQEHPFKTSENQLEA